MIIAEGVAVIVGVTVGAGVLVAHVVAIGVVLGAGVAVCSGAQEVRRRARREMRKSRVCIAFHSRVSRRVLPSNDGSGMIGPAKTPAD